MDTVRTTLRGPRAARRGPRLLAALALGAALVAIPATRPEDAGALRMSEGTARWFCSWEGGSFQSHWEGLNSGSSTCVLPSGEALFTCGWQVDYGDAYGNAVSVDHAWNCY
jgi:hypothetical protein